MIFGINIEYWILLSGLVFTIWKHFDSKGKELQWRKAEAILKLGYEFDSDNDIIEAVTIIENRNAVTLDMLFDANGQPNNSSHPNEIQKLDKLLNFLDRIAYAVEEAKTLTLNEAKNFGWYYSLILNKIRLTKYCEKNGFQDIIKIANKI